MTNRKHKQCRHTLANLFVMVRKARALAAPVLARNDRFSRGVGFLDRIFGRGRA
ncbi:hypothetical protein ABIC10_009342 [Bradyrhizobium sp. S3.2.12]